MECERKDGTPEDMFECSRCGRPKKLQPHGIGLPFHRVCAYVGVGDRVAHALAAFGITKERVTWVRGLFGAEGCGGCPEKQEALNEAGKKLGL